MLCTMLDSHPDIACIHEFYADFSKRLKCHDALAQLREKTGKKVAIGHAQFAQIHPDMLHDGSRRILLERTDTLRGAVSLLMSQIRFPHLSYNLRPEFVEYNKYERELHTFMMRPYANMTLTYEAITNNEDTREMPEWIARSLCDFIGVPYHPLTTQIKKNPPCLPANMGAIHGDYH